MVGPVEEVAGGDVPEGVDVEVWCLARNRWSTFKCTKLPKPGSPWRTRWSMPPGENLADLLQQEIDSPESFEEDEEG